MNSTRTTRTIRPAVVLSIVGAVGLALVPSVSASAHDALESSSPAAEESITADPGAISLAFSDSLLAIGGTTDGFAVQVTDGDGLHFESGCLTLDGSSVAAPVALGDAGGYVVTWQVVSSDGHPTSGQYEFDYSPASLDGAHQGLTDPPECGDPWAGAPNGTASTETATPTPAEESTAAADAPTPVATAGAAPADGDADVAPSAADVSATALPWWAIVLILIAGLGVLGAVVILVLRRMRGGDDDKR
ncbi:copper resistance protein CopC [Herbiconiux sp. P15]|uniref:copper resistance CopC family protein n=1 Tax=Herbiconiux liukaitaii TaxID=3342799 RepID=UPI0035BB6CB4